MKFNKWTLGLAAVGVVSLASAVNAEEKTPTFLDTAVSGTTISGYVNVSGHWNMNAYQNTYDSFNSSKADGFNLDAVEVTIAKPLDESEWAAGYCVQLVYGQDASSVGVPLSSSGYSPLTEGGFNYYRSSSMASIKQAYVELRVPVGNGIDLKAGVWDTILGYEGFDAGNNPNYTRSYGYMIEPTTYAGILASYKVCDVLSVQGGVANTADSALGRANVDSRKTYLGSIALTAPQSWGVLAGSTAYGGVAYGGKSSTLGGPGPNPWFGGLNGTSAGEQVNYYAGLVLNTGVKGLKVGASYDYMGLNDVYTVAPGVAGNQAGWINAVAIYGSFQATEKLSFHARGEYAWADNTAVSGLIGGSAPAEASYAVTGTVQYDLWKNVLSRVELRWDHCKDAVFTSTFQKDSILVAANLIYKF